MWKTQRRTYIIHNSPTVGILAYFLGALFPMNMLFYIHVNIIYY